MGRKEGGGKWGKEGWGKEGGREGRRDGGKEGVMNCGPNSSGSYVKKGHVQFTTIPLKVVSDQDRIGFIYAYIFSIRGFFTKMTCVLFPFQNEWEKTISSTLVNK